MTNFKIFSIGDKLMYKNSIHEILETDNNTTIYYEVKDVVNKDIICNIKYLHYKPRKEKTYQIKIKHEEFQNYISFDKIRKLYPEYFL